MVRYSVIVPVFNRPDEVDELLDSLTRQSVKDFEVVIVEDGSAVTCKDVCEKYTDSLDLHYHYKENSGPGQSRNYGAERAHGEWLIVLDSDVVLPEGYLEAGATITLNGENFNYKVNMPADEVLANSVVSENATEFTLNKVNAGTQKFLLVLIFEFPH